MPLNAFTQEVRDQVTSINREGCEKLRQPLSLRLVAEACKPRDKSMADWMLKGNLDAALIAHIYAGRYDLAYATMRQAGVLNGNDGEAVATNVASGYAEEKRAEKPVQLGLGTGLVKVGKRR